MVDCPDLVEFGCAAPGLGGDPKLVEGGGEPFNHDTDYNKEVTFHLERMAGLAGHGTSSYLQVAILPSYNFAVDERDTNFQARWNLNSYSIGWEQD